MAVSKHTPGPWKVIPDTSKPKNQFTDNRFVATGDCEMVKMYDEDFEENVSWCATGSLICDLRDKANIAANARLIAAAPEMFELLKLYVSGYDVIKDAQSLLVRIEAKNE